jgi:transmembrane sensor
LEQHFSEDEWNESDLPKDIPADTDRKAWKEIRRQTGLQAAHRRKLLLYTSAVSIMLIVVVGSWFNFHQSTTLQKNYTSRTSEQTIENPQLSIIKNSGQQNKIIHLPDGSIITLTGESTVIFETAFKARERKITLSGRAFFQVAKDKKRPFSVLSANVITTALGTSFWVNAFDKEKNVTVTLITGKVIIREQETTSKTMQPVYLNAGQELVFTKRSHVTNVHAAQLIEIVQPAPAKRNLVPNTDDHLVFNQQPLQQVLNTLSKKYKVPIRYEKSDLENKKFTGTYTNKDQLENILSAIAFLNDLQVKKDQEGYTLTH